MKKLYFMFCFLPSLLFAQAELPENDDIVVTIDRLSTRWENEIEILKTHQGFGDCCHNSNYRAKIIDLLNEIHHYDTSLYQIVTHKYNTNQDKEASATIEDINTLEVDYATKAFLRFLHSECGLYNTIEGLAANEKLYKTEVKIMETELRKYVKAITYQVNIIDKHVHHLKGL